jgi:hypothetical protein
MGQQLTTTMRHLALPKVAQRRSLPTAALRHPHPPRGVVVAQATDRCRRATCATLRHPARRGGGATWRLSCERASACAEVAFEDTSTGLSSLGSHCSRDALTAIAVRSGLALASP